MSVVDLVCDVLGLRVAEAARWIAERFDVRQIPKRRHLEPNKPLRWCDVGHEQPIELLVKSGIWARLSPQAQRIAPVLFCLATKEDRDTFRVQISNRAIMRYSGAKSFSSVSKAISQLEEIEWLQCVPGTARAGAELRSTSTYLLTPYSDALQELANATFVQQKQEIEAEREIRKQQRRARREAMDAAPRCVATKPTDDTPSFGIKKYNPLYTRRSAGQNGATHTEASNETTGVDESLDPKKERTS